MNGAISPFERTRLSVKPRDFIAQMMEHHGITREQAKRELERLLADEVWINDEYQVNIDKNPPHAFRGMNVWHLSIKRRDKQALHDWRDLQAIKNALCGPETEGVELYPAESRVVDTANQYHIWVFMPEKDGEEYPRVPVGWTQRKIINESKAGAVQRHLPEPA